MKVRAIKMKKMREYITRLISQRTKKDSDMMRQVAVMFGRPTHGITLPVFQHYMHATFGVKLSDDEAAELFYTYYDIERSGSVSLATFLKRALPPDFSGEQWNHRRDKECIQAAEAHLSADPVPQWPKSLEHNRLSVEDYVALIRQKILERTKRPSDQYREAFRLFGSPHDGIPRHTFRKLLRQKLGISIDEPMSELVFNAIDDNDSGHIDFNELVSHVMGKDITEMQFYERRAREDEAKVAAQIAAGPAPRVLTDWPKSMTYHRSSFEDIMVLIRQKIVERTKRPSDQYRTAFRMFGSPQDGISKEDLKFRLRSMNIVISDAEIDRLFNMTDLNRNGKLEFSEMVRVIMPKDYTQPTWAEISDMKTREKMAAKEKAWFDELPKRPPGMDERPPLVVQQPEESRAIQRSARHYLESSRSRSDLKQHRKTNEQRALERRAQRRDQVPAYTKVRPAKLASWRKPKQRAQRDPLLQAALRASKSAPILAPTYHKVPQPVGLSSRGIRSGMLRSLKLGASPESHERRRSQHHGPRRGAADLLPQEKAALQKLPVLPTGSMHVSVVPVLDG